MPKAELARIAEGSDAAVLPDRIASPADVLEISTVVHCGEVFILLANGRQFATTGGVGIGNSRGLRIVPATEPHRQALAKSQSHRSRSQKSLSNNAQSA